MMEAGRARRGDTANPFRGIEGIVLREVERIWEEGEAYRRQTRINDSVKMLQFPDELLIEIIRRLSPACIGQLNKVSLRFSRIVKSDYLWLRKCQDEFPGVSDVLEIVADQPPNPWSLPPPAKDENKPPSWKDIYRSWYSA